MQAKTIAISDGEKIIGFWDQEMNGVRKLAINLYSDKEAATAMATTEFNLSENHFPIEAVVSVTKKGRRYARISMHFAKNGKGVDTMKEMYPQGMYYFTLIGDNGQPVGGSHGETYHNKADLIKTLNNYYPGFPIVDETLQFPEDEKRSTD